MNITLYPYNYYILLASFVLVAICLGILLAHLITLSHTLEENESTFENIKNLSTATTYKSNALQEKKKEDDKNNKYYKVLAPILLAIFHTYRTDMEDKGAKGYRKATTKVIKRDILSDPMKFLQKLK